MLKGNAEEMRAQFGGLISALAPHYPPHSGATESKDGVIGDVKYRVYTPKAADSDKATPRPLGIYYHGGGFVIGVSEADDFLCRTLAERTGAIIVCSQYRLSPEHKAPAHLQDGVRAFEYVSRRSLFLYFHYL